MYPELIKIGGFPIRSFGVMIAIGFIVAILIARKRAPRYGIQPDKIWDISFWLMLSGVLGARITYILTHLSYFQKYPSELWALQFEGLTSFGGLIAGLLAAVVYCRIHKISLLTVLDVFAVPVLVAHAFGRVGCFLNGCCFGIHASPDLPWAVHFVGVEGLHHPAQLYDTFLSLIGAFLLTRMESRRLAPGQSITMMFVLYSVSRFIHEFWRDTDHGNSTFKLSLPITDAQAVSLLIIVVAGALFVHLGKRKPAAAL
jgi:phosphatidylglycerol:prolipoprotein diacylglycerol transferase